MVLNLFEIQLDPTKEASLLGATISSMDLDLGWTWLEHNRNYKDVEGNSFILLVLLPSLLFFIISRVIINKSH